MFRIHDHELSVAELQLFEEVAGISPGGEIYLPGQSRARERGTFNLCEILLEWSTAEVYGVQRIRLGVDAPLTRARWQRKLRHRAKTKSLLERSVWSRRVSLKACFPHETVSFRTLGWRLMNVEFFRQGKNTIKIDEAPEARITQVFVTCLDGSSSPCGAKLQ